MIDYLKKYLKYKKKYLKLKGGMDTDSVDENTLAPKALGEKKSGKRPPPPLEDDFARLNKKIGLLDNPLMEEDTNTVSWPPQPTATDTVSRPPLTAAQEYWDDSLSVEEGLTQLTHLLTREDATAHVNLAGGIPLKLMCIQILESAFRPLEEGRMELEHIQLTGVNTKITVLLGEMKNWHDNSGGHNDEILTREILTREIKFEEDYNCAQLIQICINQIQDIGDMDLKVHLKLSEKLLSLVKKFDNLKKMINMMLARIKIGNIYLPKKKKIVVNLVK